MWNRKLKKQILRLKVDLQVDQWKESQKLLDRFYEETNHLWERINELESKLEGAKGDLPRVSQSRGCIKIIL
jgi:chromosome segregation ATPase